MRIKLVLFCKIINLVYFLCRVLGKTRAQRITGHIIRNLVLRDLKNKFDVGPADFVLGKWINASRCVQDVTRVDETHFIVNRCFFAQRIHPDVRHFVCLCDDEYWQGHKSVRIIKTWPTIAQGAEKCYMEVKKKQ